MRGEPDVKNSIASGPRNDSDEDHGIFEGDREYVERSSPYEESDCANGPKVVSFASLQWEYLSLFCCSMRDQKATSDS